MSSCISKTFIAARESNMCTHSNANSDGGVKHWNKWHTLSFERDMVHEQEKEEKGRMCRVEPLSGFCCRSRFFSVQRQRGLSVHACLLWRRVHVNVGHSGRCGGVAVANTFGRTDNFTSAAASSLGSLHIVNRKRIQSMNVIQHWFSVLIQGQSSLIKPIAALAF